MQLPWKKREAALASHNTLLTELAQFYLNRDSLEDNHHYDFLVFSKNRPIQLFCLLETMLRRTTGDYRIHVLFHAEGTRMQAAYQELQSDPLLTGIRFMKETDFSSQLIEIIGHLQGSRLLFFTDDSFISGDWSTDDLSSIHPMEAVFSLRHGKNLTYSFPYGAQQKVPALTPYNRASHTGLVSFEWQHQYLQSDWSYPLSVDGHMFLREELNMIVNNMKFSSPNTLEGAMQMLFPLFSVRKGICFEYSKLAHVHCNRVQHDFHNRFTGKHTVESLLEHWESSMKIDIRSLCGNIDPSLELEFNFCKR